jgi:hypothetical protein
MVERSFSGREVDDGNCIVSVLFVESVMFYDEAEKDEKS